MGPGSGALAGGAFLARARAHARGDSTDIASTRHSLDPT
jgi:hypothetical protein